MAILPIDITRSAPTRPSLVVVEDDPSTAGMLRDVLDDAGYRVELFASALGVPAALRRRPPEAVLLDLALPYRSGVQVLRERKADPVTAAIPVIIVSANTDLLPRDDQARAAAVIAKPFHLTALLAAIDAAVEAAPGDGAAP